MLCHTTRGAVGSRILIEPERVECLLPPIPQGSLPTGRDLFLQAMLHLPRLAAADGTMEISAAVAEIERLRERRVKELASVRPFAVAPHVGPSLGQLDVQVITADQAEPVIAHYHYLRSFREDSLN